MKSVQFSNAFSYSEQMSEVNGLLGGPYTRLLSGMGIHLLLPDGVPVEGWADALLTRGRSQQEYAVFVRPSFTLSDAAWIAEEKGPTLVFTDFMSPRTADALRRARVQYLDTAGNASIEFGDVLIDVRGRARPKDVEPPARDRQPVQHRPRAGHLRAACMAAALAGTAPQPRPRR